MSDGKGNSGSGLALIGLIAIVIVAMFLVTSVVRGCSGTTDPCSGLNGVDRTQCLDEHGR